VKRIFRFFAMVLFCGALIPLIFFMGIGKRSIEETPWIANDGTPHLVTGAWTRLGVGDIIRLSNGQLSRVEFIDAAGDLVTVIVHSGSGICDTAVYSFEQFEQEGAYPIYRSDARYRKARQEIDSPRCESW
jgi:hypothetical protein